MGVRYLLYAIMSGCQISRWSNTMVFTRSYSSGSQVNRSSFQFWTNVRVFKIMREFQKLFYISIYFPLIISALTLQYIDLNFVILPYALINQNVLPSSRVNYYYFFTRTSKPQTYSYCKSIIQSKINLKVIVFINARLTLRYSKVRLFFCWGHTNY